MRNKHSHLVWIGCAASVFGVILAVSAAGGIPAHGLFVKAQQKSGAAAASVEDKSMTVQSGFYCNLKALSATERLRHALLSARLTAARVETKELPDGYAFRLNTDALSLSDLAAWVSNERKCCSFFEFDIELQPDDGSLWLKLRGKEGVKQFVRSEFGVTLAQTDKSARVLRLGEALDAWVTNTEKLVVPAAAAMPENKYAFAPSTGEYKGEFNGVRTFAEQVTHLAAANYQLGALVLGEKPPHAERGERAPESLRTRAEIIEYLKGSFDYLHRAAATICAENAADSIEHPSGRSGGTRVGFLVDALAHSQNHYGQMVEYLRMNGIVPPASR